MPAVCPCTSRNPVSALSGRLAGWMFGKLDTWADQWYASLKPSLFQPFPGQILEIGAGAGINFHYYPPGTRVLAVEPNRFMHPKLRERANKHQINLEILPVRAESIPLPDNSIDQVVGTLVLCSVDNPENVLSEIHRVLRDQGTYHFVEHVGADGLVGGVQNALYWPWRLVFDGCRLNRDSESYIRASGFDWTVVSRCKLGPRFLPIRPHILGRAMKSKTSTRL